jgi:hypothetical protein
MNNQTRFCPACQTDKPLSDFYLKTDKRTGNKTPYSFCKPCDTEKKAAWYARKRETQWLDQYRNIFKNQPCSGCYRAARCVDDPIFCAAFNEWAERGSYTPAFVGMVAREVTA